NSMLLLFGGLDESNTTTGQIYIYDIPTNTWKRGTPSKLTQAKMACATAGDYFVVWGGSPSSYSTSLLDTNTTYHKSNKVAIIGGSVGAVVVIGATIGFVFICHRRQNNKKHRKFDDLLQHLAKVNPDPNDTTDKTPVMDFGADHKNYDIKTEIPMSDFQENQEYQYLLPGPTYFSPPPPTATTAATAPVVLMSPTLLAPQYVDPNRQGLYQGLYNHPQYVGPIPVLTQDYDKTHPFPLMSPFIHSPHGPYTSMPDRDIPLNTLKEVAEMHAWYEQSLHRMHQEHQAELAKNQEELTKQNAKIAEMRKVLENRATRPKC
ncbi:hypothetical protein FBU30_002052, partial [Linnemannia zychae]